MNGARILTTLLLTGTVACTSGHSDGDAVGSPGIGVASVDTDAATGSISRSAVDGDGGVPKDGGGDAPEE
jgi:hypothetical protein